MIMMPTHGRGIFRRMLLGSVTAKVLHDAACPVWTSAHTEELPDGGQPTPSKILCAVDLMASSAALIQWTAQLAADTGASLRLIHAVPGAAAWPERQFNSELEQALKDKARKEISALLEASGLDFPICISPGDVAAVVSEEAHGHGADLVVIGRGVIHEKLGRLRTHVHNVIRQAPCPVISV
jgi:nucleotide-binding universal stress UspA family protein